MHASLSSSHTHTHTQIHAENKQRLVEPLSLNCYSQKNVNFSLRKYECVLAGRDFSCLFLWPFFFFRLVFDLRVSVRLVAKHPITKSNKNNNKINNNIKINNCLKKIRVTLPVTKTITAKRQWRLVFMREKMTDSGWRSHDRVRDRTF